EDPSARAAPFVCDAPFVVGGGSACDPGIAGPRFVEDEGALRARGFRVSCARVPEPSVRGRRVQNRKEMKIRSTTILCVRRDVKCRVSRRAWVSVGAAAV